MIFPQVPYHAAMLLNMHNRAEQDLEYIRAAMARVEGVSSVSGMGGMLMGFVACAACCPTLLQRGW